jgi:hypothetical protein
MSRNARGGSMFWPKSQNSPRAAKQASTAAPLLVEIGQNQTRPLIGTFIQCSFWSCWVRSPLRATPIRNGPSLGPLVLGPFLLGPLQWAHGLVGRAANGPSALPVRWGCFIGARCGKS